ncbi:beta-N-acetylhexosaminidase [Bacillus shivajii]|uniref:beta-N-acetylhexosaminidase n=1 Tax=Bacillus shivajii TaxID=1983719 RepID=UPI001CF9BA3E|nr:beta-N-acetylhexosaminidase [Bacillus shivajii]UCZ52978.1 beta-N-acetylhexosaminidase [Bacillus shivajii]
MNNNIKKKLGQMMVFGFNADHPSKVSDEMKEMIEKHHVGGVILFGRNIGTPKDILTLTNKLQRIARDAGHEHPLFITIDQENGVVRRLGEGTTVFPGAMLLGATQEPKNAYKTGRLTAKELKALGINWNLAPVVDVNNNPLNQVIGVRSFGEDAKTVAQFSEQAMKGMQDAEVMTTIKHFPGHGDTDLDSHLELPTIKHTMERLENVELIPFKQCIENGADVVMTSHVYFPALEPREGVPATLSRSVLTGLLRDKLDFRGLITTDCMEMKAIADTIGTANGAVEAMKAGVDLIMISLSYDLQVNALRKIEHSFKNGEIGLGQIEASYERVMLAKEKYLSWDDLQLDRDIVKVPEIVGCNQHKKEADEIFQQGVTVVENKGETLPLGTSSEQKTLVIYPENGYLTMAEDKRYSSHALGQVIQENDENAKTAVIGDDEESIDALIKQAEQYDTLIIGTISAANSSHQQNVVKRLKMLNKTMVIVAMRSPYDINYLPEVDAYVTAYEFTTPALRFAAKAIYGKIDVNGRSPVTLKV